MTHTENVPKVPSHFKGKDPLQHIAQVQAEGRMISSEIHGAETSGMIFAFQDASRDIAMAFLILVTSFSFLELAKEQALALIGVFCLAYAIWKFARSTLLSWSRMQRLHRVVQEEKFEIENNRGEERQELLALYQAKGFQGKLLDDVVDVLMADSDRLLRVMLEEEMGFRLEENEHPLVTGFFAGLGAIVTGILCAISYAYFQIQGSIFMVLLILAISSYVSSTIEHNRRIPNIVWNVSIGILCYALAHYAIQFFFE